MMKCALWTALLASAMFLLAGCANNGQMTPEELSREWPLPQPTTTAHGPEQWLLVECHPTPDGGRLLANFVRWDWDVYPDYPKTGRAPETWEADISPLGSQVSITLINLFNRPDQKRPILEFERMLPGRVDPTTGTNIYIHEVGQVETHPTVHRSGWVN